MICTAALLSGEQGLFARLYYVQLWIKEVPDSKSGWGYSLSWNCVIPLRVD